MGRKCIDLTGQKFGRLTVIEREENKGGQPCWLCQCECGNIKTVRGDFLRSGHTTSCGCLQREKTKELWQDEDYRKMMSDKMKELNEEIWQDNDYREMMSEKAKKLNEKQWQDNDYREMKSKQMKEQWQDEEMKWKIGYKGGITPISMYLRNSNSQWFDDCKKQVNYTCQLTGKTGVKLNTHHLKAFSTIVIEAHNLHDIPVKDQVKDYTQEELKFLEEYVGSWHKDNSNAVVLCKEVHELFHHEYGYGDNTPEQFEEFKERYLAGEFKKIL